MKSFIAKTIHHFAAAYCGENCSPALWLSPIVKYVDADHPEIGDLKRIVTDAELVASRYLRAFTRLTLIVTKFREIL